MARETCYIDELSNHRDKSRKLAGARKLSFVAILGRAFSTTMHLKREFKLSKSDKGQKNEVLGDAQWVPQGHN